MGGRRRGVGWWGPNDDNISFFLAVGLKRSAKFRNNLQCYKRRSKLHIMSKGIISNISKASSVNEMYDSSYEIILK
jgi:hypothetical protein